MRGRDIRSVVSAGLAYLSLAGIPAAVSASLLKEVADADHAADGAVAAISTTAELSAHQARWRTVWLRGLGGLPERTPLRAQEGVVTVCDGFTLQNVLFESLPGVYVVGHLALPTAPQFRPPYPAVAMPMGHSDRGILYPPYADHLAMMARAGFAAFTWDPLSQGERRQGDPRFDATWGQCASEHTRLGARGWLVGWNFARFRIWDGIRAIDYLASRKDVGLSRLGVCGTSGGGTMSAYLQALDSRVKVAFPNCFVSSIRDVFACRGCHDAEQFYWGQLTDGLNHAAILALGQPRVQLAVGSRWEDYFPQRGTAATVAILSDLQSRLGVSSRVWHFHCAGPHGLAAPTRAAQVDWMRFCVRGGEPPRALSEYWRLSTGDHRASDPANGRPLPFPEEATFFTPTRQVRDRAGFRSLYSLMAERARVLAATRKRLSRERLREVVRRRANIRPLAQLRAEERRPHVPFDHPNFGWWYLSGAFGMRRENEAGMLATLGRSVVGRDAENIILRSLAEGGGRPVCLRAKGWNCIAAAHALAAEPELFSGIDFQEPPPSWTQLVTDPDSTHDSFAIGVWGALAEYDWTDLVRGFVRSDARDDDN